MESFLPVLVKACYLGAALLFILGIKRMMTLSEDIIRSLIVIHEKESAKTL